MQDSVQTWQVALLSVSQILTALPVVIRTRKLHKYRQSTDPGISECFQSSKNKISSKCLPSGLHWEQLTETVAGYRNVVVTEHWLSVLNQIPDTKKHLHKLLRHVLQEKIHNKYYKIHTQVFWANISIIDGEQIVYSVDNYIHFSKQTTPQTCSH